MTWRLRVTMTAGRKEYAKEVSLVPFKKIKKIKHLKAAKGFAWELYLKMTGASNPEMVWVEPLDSE